MTGSPGKKFPGFFYFFLDMGTEVCYSPSDAPPIKGRSRGTPRVNPPSVRIGGRAGAVQLDIEVVFKKGVVAEPVDAPDSKSGSHKSEGSSPSRAIQKIRKLNPNWQGSSLENYQ